MKFCHKVHCKFATLRISSVDDLAFDEQHSNRSLPKMKEQSGPSSYYFLLIQDLVHRLET